MATTTPQNFIGVSQDQVIYRIYEKNRFMELLDDKNDALVNPSKWEDPFENFFLQSTKVVTKEGQLANLKNLANVWYGQCWTRNEDTDAMWRIYSDPKTKDGIKVKTTVRKLFANLEASGSVAPYLQFFVGQVAYKTEDEIYDLMRGLTFLDIAYGGQGYKFAELLCIKREAFSHEAEVRILFQDIEPLRGVDRVLNYALDANDIFDEVVVDPRLNEADAQALQLEIQSKGYVGEIKQSSLYRSPSFTIPLQSKAFGSWT